MKKIVLIFIIVVIVTMIVLGMILIKSKTHEGAIISTVSQVTLNSEQYINSLQEININATNDSIIITEDVKWNIPDYGEGTTVSFSITIPYKFTVDGQEYNGIYELGNAPSRIEDNNPKYRLKITDLTPNGEIKILVTKK